MEKTLHQALIDVAELQENIATEITETVTAEIQAKVGTPKWHQQMSILLTKQFVHHRIASPGRKIGEIIRYLQID